MYLFLSYLFFSKSFTIVMMKTSFIGLIHSLYSLHFLHFLLYLHYLHYLYYLHYLLKHINKSLLEEINSIPQYYIECSVYSLTLNTNNILISNDNVVKCSHYSNHLFSLDLLKHILCL